QGARPTARRARLRLDTEPGWRRCGCSLSDIATRENAREITVANELMARDAAKASGRTTSTRAPSSIEVYRRDFERQKPGQDWLQRLREHGIARFEALGYPTTKNEDWHFTSVAPIAERAFRLAAPASQADTDRRESIRRKSDFANALGLKPADLERFGFGQTDWHRLVFINGVFDESLSSFEEVGDAIRVGSLASAIESGAPLLERYLGKIASFDQHTFTALNTAFISDG